MVDQQESTQPSARDLVLDNLRGALQEAHTDLNDISQKIATSRSQVEQLAQRNAKVVGEVRRIEAALEQTPRLTLRETYTEALDVRQRLLTTRCQLERLQAEEVAAQRMVDLLEETIQTLSQPEPGDDEDNRFNAREIIVRVIDAQEEQSERLARMMHDGPAHALTNFILQAEIVQKLFDKDPVQARAELDDLKASAGEAFQRVRSFIFDLRPMMLTDLGLVPTLRRYVSAFGDKTGIHTEFELIGRERRVEHYREVLIFRGVQALLQNARDQSAASNVHVTLDLSGDEVRSVVEDDGRGFGTGRLSLDANSASALGLGALQERVHLVGGHVRVDSVAGQGAQIEIVIPAGPEVF